MSLTIRTSKIQKKIVLGNILRLQFHAFSPFCMELRDKGDMYLNVYSFILQTDHRRKHSVLLFSGFLGSFSTFLGVKRGEKCPLKFEIRKTKISFFKCRISCLLIFGAKNTQPYNARYYVLIEKFGLIIVLFLFVKLILQTSYFFCPNHCFHGDFKKI